MAWLRIFCIIVRVESEVLSVERGGVDMTEMEYAGSGQVSHEKSNGRIIQKIHSQKKQSNERENRSGV